jgi:hypothetical protein
LAVGAVWGTFWAVSGPRIGERSEPVFWQVFASFRKKSGSRNTTFLRIRQIPEKKSQIPEKKSLIPKIWQYLCTKKSRIPKIWQ